MHRALLLLPMLSALVLGCNISLPDRSAGALRLDAIELPDGFAIDVFARMLPEARSLAVSENGTLFVGTRQAGSVYALVDADGDARADTAYTIAEDLHQPNGVAVRDGDLYVAEVSRILRYDGIETRLGDPPAPAVVYDDLPSDEHHGWKYIAFGPDGKLYVPVGAPCNICDPETPYASILRMNADGSDVEIYARGVRNTVGFDWDPATGDLWFTDNGRDWLGNDRPPDELNHAPAAGLHFGYPHVHGENILDTEFGQGHDPGDYVPPAQALGPHVAALGMTFYTGDLFPAEYRNQAFIAEHGSWNRSEKIGYRVTLVRLNDDRAAVRYEPFAEGWLQGNSNWGRPVDLALMPDGALLISDDQTGTIYRIAYTDEEQAEQSGSAR